MRAAVVTKYGPPDIIKVKKVAKPGVNEGEILIKVKYSTVNRTDCGFLRADPWIVRLFSGLAAPKRKIVGSDFAGIVEKIGEGVESFKIGDKVFGFYDEGLQSKAEYMVISERGNVGKIPNRITFETAAASLEAAHYAYNFIKKVNLKKGQKVLVNGGTGAIGSAMIQFLKDRDLKITAVCGTKYLKTVKKLGADTVIDYQKEDFTKLNTKFDFVFDAVGKNSFGKCKKIMKKKGIYVSSELGNNLQNIFYALFTPIFGGKKVIFPLPTDIKKSIEYISEMLSKGKFKPLIDRTYSLDKIVDAYKYVETGQKIGNVLIKI